MAQPEALVQQGRGIFGDSWLLLVIVEREVTDTAHVHHVREVECFVQAIVFDTYTPSTAMTQPTRTPRRCWGTHGGQPTLPYTAGCASLRGHCVDLYRCTSASRLGLLLSPGLPLSGSEQEAPAEQIEACPAKHLALQHL